jgi:hypothetical protein
MTTSVPNGIAKKGQSGSIEFNYFTSARVFSPQDKVHDKEDNKDSSSNKTGSQDRIC